MLVQLYRSHSSESIISEARASTEKKRTHNMRFSGLIGGYSSTKLFHLIPSNKCFHKESILCTDVYYFSNRNSIAPSPKYKHTQIYCCETIWKTETTVNGIMDFVDLL